MIKTEVESAARPLHRPSLDIGEIPTTAGPARPHKRNETKRKQAKSLKAYRERNIETNKPIGRHQY